MTRIGIFLGGVALIMASAGHAQLLGGGGGIGGGFGGGLGNTMGGIGGGIGGTLRGDRLGDATRTDGVRARRAVPQRPVPAAGAVGGGSVTGNGGMAGLGGAVTGGIAASLDARAPRPAVDDALRSRSYAVRTDAAIAERGLRRAGRSAAGVSVYLPATAIGVPVVVAQPYPVYAGGYGGGYDAAPEVVVVPDRSYMDRQYRDLQDDAAGTGVTVERRGDDLVLQLPADITFAFDRADIQPRFVAALDAVARTIAEYRGTDVEILGHTDSVGSDAYNYALSQRRGSSVADFLVSRRAAPDRLIVEAMGESEPVATNATIAGRAANRRVEIVLHPREA